MTASTLTITLNPAVDISSEAEVIRPIHKIRTYGERHDPGGGGINVARVITRLGGSVEALYMAGGPMGSRLVELLDQQGVAQYVIPSATPTRLSFNVFERETGFEYRFVPAGQPLAETELERCCDYLKQFKGRFVVASGSVPAGMSDDILVRMAEMTKQIGAKFIVDSSGDSLKHVLETGQVYLAKPSLSELEQIVGDKLDEHSARAAAHDLVKRGSCRMVAVTLGVKGAILASEAGVLRVPALHVATKSATGAGDSFVGAMTWALAEGWQKEQAFALAVAAGAATALTPGTELCRREDVFRLYEQGFKQNNGMSLIQPDG